MDTVKKIGRGISYFLGVIIPNITFVIIFVTFMVTIVSRYVLKAPVAWSYEICILAYMWTMFFGVGKALANDEHVVFGLVYDHVSPRTQLIFKILSNTLLVVLLVVVFIPSVQSLLSKRMVTGVLKWPFTVVFAPIIYMFAEIIVRSAIDLWKNIKDLKSLGGKEAEEVKS